MQNKENYNETQSISLPKKTLGQRLTGILAGLFQWRKARPVADDLFPSDDEHAAHVVDYIWHHSEPVIPEGEVFQCCNCGRWDHRAFVDHETGKVKIACAECGPNIQGLNIQFSA